MPKLPIAKNAKLLEEWRLTLNDEILKSPCPPISIPDETFIERTLKALKVHASKFPQKVAVIEAANQNRSLSYQQVHDKALSFAGFLMSRGYSIGDRVTVAMPNSIKWPVAILGTWAAGGTIIGSNTTFKLYETVYQLQDSSSSIVVTSEATLSTIIEAAKECPAVKMIICVRSSEKPLPDGVIDFEETLRHEPLKEIAPVTQDTVCMIYYTSGTTGQPKGVIHTQRTFHLSVEMIRSYWCDEIYPMLGVPDVNCYEENHIINSPCYHTFGFRLLNLYLLTGTPTILMKGFDVDVYLDVVEKYKPRELALSPAIFSFLAKDPVGRKAKLSSVQLVTCTSTTLSEELSDEFFTCHPSIKYIVQAYGMTETGPSHLPLLLEEGVNASGGIVDPETLKPCKQGQQGELWLRGAPQTIGYLNKPEATKAFIDEERWMHTGDIGYIDEQGLLWIVDRMQELITINYNNQSARLAPAELEGILISNSKIKDAAIVGITTDNVSDQLIRAFVVKADETLTVKEVETMISDRLSEFKHITGGVFFVDEIPRSPAGKILRRVLREPVINSA